MRPESHSQDAASQEAAELDRLVDGELAPVERRELLHRFEVEPLGWRRCALAFLEAQAFRESLSLFDDKLSLRPQRLAAASPRRSDRFRFDAFKFDTVGMFLAAAASFLIAFFLGVNSSGLWSGGRPRSGPAPVGPSAGQIAGDVLTPVGSDAAQAIPVEWDGSQGPGQSQWGTLDLAVGNAGQDEQFAVPVVSGPGVDESTLAQQPPPLSDALVRQLRRQGYEIQYERELFQMPLDGGRRAVVPVDKVHVQFVGDQRIQ